jgi:adenosylcobyric acid synthase
MDHAIDDEDGVTERFNHKEYGPSDIDICVVRLPHISNFTDFIPLESVSGVRVRWCDTRDAVGTPDLLILPGTKATIADLQVLRKSGLADEITKYVKNGGTVLGICGGFQMLGRRIVDPACAESSIGSEEGLGMLDMTTTFSAEKRTVQTRVSIHARSSWLFSELDGVEASGYEIHMGQSEYGPSAIPFTQAINLEGTGCITGVSDATGRVIGTYLHGLFDTGSITTGIINGMRKRKNLPVLDSEMIDRRLLLEKDLNRLADTCRGSLNMDQVYGIIQSKNAT